MGDAERAAVRAGHLHDGAGLGTAAVGYVTRENPGVAGGEAAGRLAVDADFGQRIACRRAMRSAVEG